jgi:hypothetical protein
MEVVGSGLARLGSWLLRLKRPSPETLGRVFAGLLMTVALGSTLPKLLEPLHSDRSGFRQAGEWLGEHLSPDDAVFDPYRWSGYYAGQDFKPHLPLSQARVRYVVVEHSEKLDHVHLLAHLQALEMSKHGRQVYSWKGKRGKQHVEIGVYALPPRW